MCGGGHVNVACLQLSVKTSGKTLRAAATLLLSGVANNFQCLTVRRARVTAAAYKRQACTSQVRTVHIPRREKGLARDPAMLAHHLHNVV